MMSVLYIQIQNYVSMTRNLQGCQEDQNVALKVFDTLFLMYEKCLISVFHTLRLRECMESISLFGAQLGITDLGLRETSHISDFLL